jgi:hypothetical protein
MSNITDLICVHRKLVSCALIITLVSISVIITIIFIQYDCAEVSSERVGNCLYTTSLGNGYRLSVCNNIIDLRQFVRKRNGSLYPTIKGINLSVQQWNELSNIRKWVNCQLNRP